MTLDEHPAVVAEPRVRRVSELGEGGGEHGAALERRRFRAQEHDIAPRQTAKSAEARVRSTQCAALDLEPDAFGDSRQIVEYAVDIHGIQDTPFLPAGPLSALPWRWSVVCPSL